MIETQHYRTTWDDLERRFTGLTANEGRGGWLRLGKVFEEDNYVFKVDTDADGEKYIRKEYKETLKQRFKQEEIYIISYPVKRL